MTSPNSIVFNNETFLENLPNILAQITTNPSALAAYQAMSGATFPPNTNITGFFAQFASAPTTGSGTTTPDVGPFTDAAAFFAAWGKYLSPTNAAQAATFATALQGAFVTSFRTILNMGASGAPSGDWSLLGQAGVTENQIVEEFLGSFSQFLANYQYAANGSVGGTTAALTAFFNQWATYMTVTSNLQNSTSTSSGLNLATYEQVYLAYGFPPADFGKTLKKFYDNYVEPEPTASDPNNLLNNVVGWFIPSQAFAAWFQQMQTDFIASKSSSSAGSSDKLNVINSILHLLIDMISVLENISASQAQRLNFLSKWQQAYTQLLANIPVISQGGDNPISGTGTDATNWRQSASTVTSTAQTNVQAFQSNVQDIAKQMQSTVSQSQDAANQQTDMATSILQQMDTILSQIFR